MIKKESRRSFITKTTVAAAGVSMGIPAISSASASRIIGANDKIRMGFIGIGNRGSQLLKMFMQYDDVEVTGDYLGSAAIVPTPLSATSFTVTLARGLISFKS